MRTSTLLLLSLSTLAHAQDPYRAVAGAPVLAQVGDRVQLSAEWSTGPDPRVYTWTQTEGPTVALSDPAAERPSFTATEPGFYLFQVTVGDGATASAPTSSQVAVVDPDLRRHTGAGCMAAPGGPAAWLALLALPLLRRRSA